MSKLKALAGQTAIYGVSSILGRIINYFLVGLHTQVFLTDQMGQVSVLYGYTALILIIITFGMETTYFRFATKSDHENAYHVASTAVGLVSFIIALLLFVSAPTLVGVLPASMNNPATISMIHLLAAILFIDGITAIPFALLRIENRPLKFATGKLIAIFTNIGLQLLFLLGFPYLREHQFMHSMVSAIYTPNLGIQYIFIANLLSNSLLFIVLWKEFRRVRLQLNWQVLKPMLLYAVPLLLTGIAGWATNFFDQIAIAAWSPENGLANQGVYSQTFKLGAIMMLAIQAFRYAAEPFFFSQFKSPDAPALYSKTLYYFTLSGLGLMLAICFNIDLIANILLRNPAFRVALYLVPIIMFGKLLFGVYINLSIWFKLIDKTIYGFYFTLLGSLITLGGNYFLIPRIGYLGSAVTIVFSFGAMSIACYFVGRKHLSIPYQFGRLTLYTLITLALIFASYHINLHHYLADTLLNLLVPIIVIGGIYRIERKRIFHAES